jgi:hypothetical protein
VWLLADIEAWLMGETYSESTIDIEKYRLRIRKYILALPIAGPPKQQIATSPDMQGISAWANEITTTWPVHDFSRQIDVECESNVT